MFIENYSPILLADHLFIYNFQIMWRIKTKLFIALDKFDSHNLDGSSEFKSLPAMIQRFDHCNRRPHILPLSFLREY